MTFCFRRAACVWIAIGTVLLSGVCAQDEVREAHKQSYRYEQSQNYKDAINALLVLKEKGYLEKLRLGWLYYLSGNFANSRENYQAAIAAAPKAVEPRLGYLYPLLAQARYAEVETVAKQILALDPDNYYGSMRLAFALRLQAKHDAALAVTERMLSLYPTDVGYLLEHGLNQTALKQSTVAKQTFEKVLNLDPENVIAKQQLSAGGK